MTCPRQDDPPTGGLYSLDGDHTRTRYVSVSLPFVDLAGSRSFNTAQRKRFAVLVLMVSSVAACDTPVPNVKSELVAVEPVRHSDRYQVESCVPHGEGTHAVMSVEVFPDETYAITSAAQAIKQASAVVMARVESVGEPKLFTPLALADQLRAKDLSEQQRFEIEIERLGATPVTLSVERTLHTTIPLEGTINVTVQGCWEPGDTSLTTPGSAVVVHIVNVTDEHPSAASEAVRGLDVHDWMSIEDGGRLSFGRYFAQLPPRAVYLDGLTVEQAIDEFAKARANS